MNPRTLADMTPTEQAECVGIWCDNLVSTAKTPSPVVLACVQGERCWVLHPTFHGEWSCFPLDAVAPRLDLPRAWTPDGDPVLGSWEYEYRPWPEGVQEPLTEGYARCFITDWEVAP